MKTKKMAAIGIFGSLAWVVSMWSFPIIPTFSFLKIDFSDIVLLFATLAYGVSVGVSAAAIRSLLSYLVDFGEMGYPIGDITAFIASLCFILPIAYAFLKYPQNKKRQLLSGVGATVLLTGVMALLNYWIVIPLYTKVLGISVGPISKYLLTGLVPFNLLKGTILFVIVVASWPKLSKVIARIK